MSTTAATTATGKSSSSSRGGATTTTVAGSSSSSPAAAPPTTNDDSNSNNYGSLLSDLGNNNAITSNINDLTTRATNVSEKQQQQQPPHVSTLFEKPTDDNNNNTNHDGVDDEYIISLIRRDSSLKDRRGGQNAGRSNDDDLSSAGSVGSVDDDDNKDDDNNSQHEATTYSQTVIHLVKGYIGCGILSLPWAVSQLGIPFGLSAIVVMSLWSSYNCWTVVRLKRYIERNDVLFGGYNNNNNNNNNDEDDNDNDDDEDDGAGSHSYKGTGTRSLASKASSVSSRASTNVTYPDVGEWAYGVDFQTYVAMCICTQQLAICTVFLSFIGENLYAVLQFLNVSALQNHQAVVSCCLPAVLVLSFIPSLKQLTPVMMAGTVLILAGFASLGVIGGLEWHNRPDPDDWPTLNPIKAPMALCGILYSFEGICIILPVESAMKEPRQFLSAFTISMIIVTMLLCGMAGLSIIAFGEVTNGSITAFLLEEFGNDDRLKLWLMISNLLVSLSIIFTYPLQLFPAVELIGPMVQNRTRQFGQRSCKWLRWCNRSDNDKQSVASSEDDEDEQNLNGFEPLEEIPEHDVASLGSLPSQHHEYGTATAAMASQDTVGGSTDNNDATSTKDADSVSRLSIMGQSVAEYFNPQMQLPGDSPFLRAFLVLGTYTVALVVPNVEALVSLAGAIAGSSTALLIPPILELAFIRHMEQRDLQRWTSRVGGGGMIGGSGHPQSSLLLPDWEGGPSEASKSSLVKTNGLLLGGTTTTLSETAPLIAATTATSQSPHHQHHHHNHHKKHHTRRHKYLFRKILSWCLLGLGTIFALFGSYFSVRDIVDIYMSS